MIKTGRVTQADRVGRSKQTEGRVRGDDLVLVKQGQFAIGFQNALDHEHNVGATCIVFVKDDGAGVAQRPRQDTFLKLGDLLAVTQFDGVLTDQVDTADVAVEVDAHTGPVQTRGNLFDMRRFTGAVITLDHDAAIVSETRQNRQRGFRIEFIHAINFRHAIGFVGKTLDQHVRVEPENFADAQVFGRPNGVVHIDIPCQIRVAQNGCID